MTRVMLCALLLAAPAYADDRAAWGASPNPDFNTSVQIAPADGPAVVATVTILNRLTGGHDMATSAVIATVGLSVLVEVIHGPGDVPDRVTVTPPEGFIAVPPVLDVQEGDSATVTIYSADGVGA